ncbi:MAG: type II toxin-antitoxin system RelE/ParE family toxin [Proteobacteria bacterium]|nr:type II toxin-antitoxin system RelE/ParE family toxin [Pseudomonadota bacterium]
MTPFKQSVGARLELLDAIRYYNRQRPGLGEEFIGEVNQLCAAVLANPLRWAPDKQGRRRALMKRFPYKLIFRVRVEDIYLIAAAHNKRAPGYWEPRDQP